MIDGVGTEEAASPEVDADSVGETFGGGDGDGVERGGVVRELGILGAVVSEGDITKDVAVDPLLWLCGFELVFV